MMTYGQLFKNNFLLLWPWPVILIKMPLYFPLLQFKFVILIESKGLKSMCCVTLLNGLLYCCKIAKTCEFYYVCEKGDFLSFISGFHNLRFTEMRPLLSFYIILNNLCLFLLKIVTILTCTSAFDSIIVLNLDGSNSKNLL